MPENWELPLATKNSWRKKLNPSSKKDFKCHFCKICDGKGCIGEMPGMGGPLQSTNFIANCAAWSKIPFGKNKFVLDMEKSDLIKKIRLAPITGAVENIGYGDEKQYYFDMIKSCDEAKIALSIGDGTPDFKFFWGIDAVKEIQKSSPQKKAAVFIKPYPQEKYFERMEKSLSVAQIFGIDIDSYNILTMRNLVHLEKKTAQQLLKIKKISHSKNIPFAVKGIFTKEDLELVKEVQPDIIYISNHGGRVETKRGSTAEFLAENADFLKKFCNELWIDGGIRNFTDEKKALSYGADCVLLGRPFISALCKNKELKNFFETQFAD